MFGLMIIRDADPQRDAAACAAIYGPYVSGSVISFEALPPGVEGMADRIGAAYAWVLAEQHGATVGYAYGSPHRERAAYRWAADVAVYIDADHHRSGIGRALYAALFEQLGAIGLWTLCAGITQPNDATGASAGRLAHGTTSSGGNWTSTPVSQDHHASSRR
jgi:L-amino acid N-acyltransferase YncA